MKQTLPSVETLKAENCPAAIALMMHEMYALLPEMMLDAKGERDQEKTAYIEEIVTELIKVRNFKDFVTLGENLLLGSGCFDPDIPLEEQFTSEEMKRPSGALKYARLIDLLGLELPSWGDEDYLKAKWINSRVATGENTDKVQWELLQEDLAEEEASGKSKRKRNEDEIEAIEKQKRTMELMLHETPEAWHPVKRFARRLKEINAEHEKTTDEQWAEFQKQETEFVQRFGLRGIRFPYCMSLETRKEGLEDIAVNLEKIAKAMDMPEHYVGFRGRMPVYYGGAISGSLGTYTYLSHTLYLLKDMGARATAHEWFHALDYDLAYQTGNNAFSKLGGAPSFSEPHLVTPVNTMKKVHQAMVSLMEGVRYGFNGGTPVNAEEYLKNDGIFWTTIKTVYAKELFRWVPKDNLQNSAQRFNFACKQLFDKEWSADQFTKLIADEYRNAISVTQPEYKDLMLTSFESEIRVLSGLYDKLREDPEYLKGERESFYRWFAGHLDNISGKEYYTIPTELIARMGEQYVFEKLGEPLREHAAPQYVMPFEKEKIQERFKAWVEEAKVFLAHDNRHTQKPKMS